jgi:excisionase family DNA binding protein
MTDNLLVSVNDACALLGLGRTKFYQLINAGEFETVTIGDRRLIVRNSIVEYVDRLRKKSVA